MNLDTNVNYKVNYISNPTHKLENKDNIIHMNQACYINNLLENLWGVW